jgi:tripartite-type tricarboxylate transporter receptor subunit TctC
MIGMIGGHVDMVVIGVPPTLPHIKAGRVRPLAVLAAERLPYLPDVPTSKEAGIANYEVITSYGILAPAGTPREVINRLNAEWLKIAVMAETKERMSGAGYEPMTSTPEQYGEFIKSEMVRWAKVIKDANVRIE